MPSSHIHAHEILLKYWGYENFRPPQAEIIESIVAGHDTLALLPTGGGKSICFQVPALQMGKLCLVITPLIALMKDQVRQLLNRGIAAEMLVSGQSFKEQEFILNRCVDGDVQFLYVSPERLHSRALQSRLHIMPIGLLAVDEAHCISQWGFDFRPEYRRLAEFRLKLKTVPIIALTATATPEVVNDICQQLELKNANIFRKSFLRENLSYVVRECENKEEQLLHILNHSHGSTLIYVRNRKMTESISQLLRKNQISASFYHAGLDANTREKRQDAWTHNHIRVMVCTNAFGMGIDKSDCRLVIHYEMPDSLEAYYQEAGRAGRDGNKAYAVLLHHPSDINSANNKLNLQYPEIKLIQKVYQALCNYYSIPAGHNSDISYPFSIYEFTNRYDIKTTDLISCLKWLQNIELIHFNESLTRASQLKFLIGQGTLYKFQVEHPNFDAFIQLLLRSYGGLFDHYIPINESLIAGRGHITNEEVVKILRKLHQLNICDYQEVKDGPHITFIHERIKPEEINIKQSDFNIRQKQSSAMLQAMIEYSVNPQFRCRSQILQNYFGENTTSDCGVCDICLSRKKEFGQAHLPLIEKQIESIVNEKPITLIQLKQRLNYLSPTDISDALRRLFDQKIITYNSLAELVWKEEKK